MLQFCSNSTSMHLMLFIELLITFSGYSWKIIHVCTSLPISVPAQQEPFLELKAKRKSVLGLNWHGTQEQHTDMQLSCYFWLNNHQQEVRENLPQMSCYIVRIKECKIKLNLIQSYYSMTVTSFSFNSDLFLAFWWIPLCMERANDSQ